MSFMTKLREAQNKLRAQQADPWYTRLEGARGKVDDEGR